MDLEMDLEMDNYKITFNDDVISKYKIDKSSSELNYKNISFQKYINKIGLKFYATRRIFQEINIIWTAIISEMYDNKIDLMYSYSEIIKYLESKLFIAPPNKKYMYSYILEKLNDYQIKYTEFNSDIKNYIYRLKCYSETRKCKNINELIGHINKYLAKHSINSDDSVEDIKYFDNIRREKWIIISRYICEFIIDMEKLEKRNGNPWVNPIFN